MVRSLLVELSSQLIIKVLFRLLRSILRQICSVQETTRKRILINSKAYVLMVSRSVSALDNFRSFIVMTAFKLRFRFTLNAAHQALDSLCSSIGSFIAVSRLLVQIKGFTFSLFLAPENVAEHASFTLLFGLRLERLTLLHEGIR